MNCNVCGRSLVLWRLEPNQLTTEPRSFSEPELCAALTRADGRGRGSDFRRVCEYCARAAFDVFHETRNRITADAFAEFCNRTENG